MNARRMAVVASSMVVVLGAFAGCEDPATTGSRPPSPAPPSAPTTPPDAPASTPPTCGDLAHATVRGDEIPYRTPLTLRDGRWWAPDGHIFLQLEPACVIGVLEAAGPPMTVGWLARQASGYTYAYRDIIVCPTAVTCVVAVSLEDHERISSITIKDAVVTVTSRIEPPYANPAVERSADYVWTDRRLQRV